MADVTAFLEKENVPVGFLKLEETIIPSNFFRDEVGIVYTTYLR